MAGGLSQLQQDILKAAAWRRLAGVPRWKGTMGRVDSAAAADLLMLEIFRDVLQWPVTPNWRQQHDPATSNAFSRKTVGKRYASDRASVSRAVTRLVRRGLVQRVEGERQKWSGLRLTVEGFDVGTTLAAG